MRRVLYIGLAAVGILLLLVIGLFGALQTGVARERLRLMIAESTAGSGTQIHLDAIEGVVPFDMRLTGLRLSDRNGIWATADRIDVDWSPLALLTRRLEVDRLAAGAIDLARMPAAEETQEPEASEGPLIPELPVTIDLRSLSIERLSLGAPILGQPATLSLQASAKLGAPRDGLSASLALRELGGIAGTATLDLAYRPDDDFLKLSGKVDEPQGGVLGQLAGLPRGSDLQIAVAGEGPLADWRGRMGIDLNRKPLLDLTAEVEGADTRTISFDLRAAPDDLLPQQIRPLLAGGVTAEGTLAIEPDIDTIAISAFAARMAAGRVDASGVLGLTEPGDLAVTLALADSRAFATLVPDIAWSGATLKARLQGTVDRPRVNAEITLQDLAAADLRVGTTSLALDAESGDGFDQPIGLRAGLRMSQIAGADPRLAAVLADGVRLDLDGSIDRAGTIVADRLELNAATIALSGTARAEQWGAAARTAEARLTIADIAAIGGPLGFPGAGSAEIALKLEPSAEGERLELTGTSQALATGQPIIDRLLGQSPRLHLALTGALPRSVTITAAEVTGARARIDAQGTVADRTLDVAFSAALDDVAGIDPAFRGKVALDGTLRGTMDAAALVAALNSPALTAAGRRLDGLTLNATAADLLAGPKIELQGSATLDRLPVRLATKIAIDGERIVAPSVMLALGKSRMTGDAVMAGGLVTGKATLDAPDLREIGQLAGTAMGGALTATLQLDGPNGRQRARLSATGQDISAADALAAPGVKLNATADDLFGALVLAADLDLAQPTIADRAFTRVSVEAKGPLTALQANVALAGTDLTAAAEAEIAQIADGYRIGLRSLTADVTDIQVRSKDPAIIELSGGTTRIDGVVLAIEDGTLRLDGSVAPDDMRLAATIESLPLSLARAFAPDLPVTGRLDGEVQVGGTTTAPSGRFTIAGTNIGATDVPQQQADLQVTGTLQQGRLDVQGELKPKSGGALTFTAALPSLGPEARVQADAKGTFDLLLLDAFLAGGADRVRGKAELDLSASGRLSAPELRGRLGLVDAGYENLRYGIKLRRIEADVRADGPLIRIASLSATTPGGGQISGTGEVDLARGVETSLRIQARNATLVDTELATASIDSDLAVTGNLASRLKLGGSITIVRADIRVPDHLPPSVQEIEVVEVNAPPRVAARIAAREPSPQQTAIIDLDLTVDAPQQVWVRGRGLDVELGGKLGIGGTTDTPAIDGGLALRRGSLDIVGRRLDFTEGQLTFDSGAQIDPLLDLTAVTRAQNLEVTAKVEGPARAPRITLSSVPTMPEDEILARLLFNKSAGALSAFELLQLAQATANLAGISSGPGVLENIRRNTGLDRLSLEQDEGAAGPSLSAGRYVADGVYVGVKQGSTSGSSTATVEIEVTPNIKVESEIGANAASKAGVNLEWDY